MMHDIERIIIEIALVLSEVDSELTKKLIADILKAKRIYTFGAGRSGLIAKAFAMRLMHLGLISYAVGETINPSIQKEDLLIACSGSGKTAMTCMVAELAKKNCAKVFAISSDPNSKLSQISDSVLILPISLSFKSAQYGGALFEQSLLIFFDSLVLRLQQKLKVSADEMAQRHSNLQ